MFLISFLGTLPSNRKGKPAGTDKPQYFQKYDTNLLPANKNQ